MAGENDSAMGLGLTIPKQVFKGLNKLEAKILKLESATDKMSNSFVSAFKRMASGTEPLMEQVEAINKSISAIKPLNISVKGDAISKIREDLEKMSAVLTETAKAMNSLPKSATTSSVMPTSGSEETVRLTAEMKRQAAEIERLNLALQKLKVQRDSNNAGQKAANNAELDFRRAMMASEATINQRINKIAKLKTAMWELRQAEKQNTDAQRDYSKELSVAGNAIFNLENANIAAAKAAGQLRRAQGKVELMSPSDAMSSSYSAKTYAQRAQAMKNLEAAIKNLDITEKDYQKTLNQLSARYRHLKAEQDKVTVSMNGVKKSQTQLMDISGQLMRRLALVFSVSQITQYVQTLARVRGEFELQNAALSAIMQNKDEADKLFGQITELAVRSPFQLKELVTYTKELAAYRIENEKLYDTTKMLADVSAGLGVDMSRLILAYGQVKAANYLRGTELRQFSEAGINILGELATYFSEIEGRAISVGEVFEMVSNRMVSFADVEEVFQRITSEGGIFANMQEVQAKTLAGMISNMKDSVDIMLNDIGQSTEGTLKGSIETVNNLIQNWREVVFQVKLIAPILGIVLSYQMLLKVAASKVGQQFAQWGRSIPAVRMMMMNVEQQILKVEQRSKLAASALRGMSMAASGLATLGIGAAITAIVYGITALIRKATEASRAAKLLNEELSKLFSEDLTNVRNSVNVFVNLVDKLKEVNKGSEEHRRIIGQINSQYGEYLGYIVTETTSYDKLKESIDDVSQSMMMRAQIATQEKALQKIYEQQNDSILEAQKNIREYLQSSNFTTIHGWMPSEKELASIFSIVEQKTKELGRTLKTKDFTSILQDFYDTPQIFLLDDLIAGAVKDYSKAILSAEQNIEQYTERINAMYGERYTTATAIAAIEENNARRQMELEEIRNRPGTTKEEVARQTEAANQLYDINEVGIKVQFGILTPEEGKREKDRIMNWVNDTAEDANRKIREILSEQDFTEDMMSPYLITADMEKQGMLEIEKSIIANYRQTEENIERQNRLKDAGNRIDEEQLMKLEQRLKGYRAMAEALGILDKLQEKQTGGGGKKDPFLDTLRQQINLIKEVQRQYDKLRDNFSDTEATSNIRLSYNKSFEDADFAPNFISTMTFDTSGIVTAFKKLMESLPDEYKSEVQKALDGYSSEVEVDVRIADRNRIKEEINELFQNYDLSFELENLGGDRSMADILGFDFTSWEDLELKAMNKARQLREKGGEDDIKLAEEIEQKTADARIKILRENTKKYLEYLRKSKDERSRIEEEYQKQLKEIENSGLNEGQKTQARQNVAQERDQKLAAYDWEQFKGMDLYRMAFEDLDRVGTQTLDLLMAKLQQFAQTTGQTLSTEDFRELMNVIKNLRSEIEERNPFEALINGIQNFVAASQNLNLAKDNLAAAASDIQSAEQEKSLAREEVESAQEEVYNAEGPEEQAAATERLAAAQQRLYNSEKQLEASAKNLEKAQEDVARAENSQAEASDTVKDSLNHISSQYSKVEQGVNTVIDGFRSFAEAAGIALDDETTAALDGFQQGFSVLGTIMSTIIPIIYAITAGGYAMQTALWPLLIIGAALGAVFAIVNASKAAREAAIDSEKEKVEDLQDAYDKLSDKIDKTTSTEGMQTLHRQMEQNIEQQIEALDNAIALAESAKNPDQEEIEELKKQREEAIESLAESEEELLSRAGGILEEDILDTTEDFVDAWLEAFQETGDGLSGLQDNFKEFFLNIVKRQAALAIADKFMDPWIKDLNSALNDYELDEEEIQALTASAMEMFPEMSEALEAFFGNLGSLMESSEDSLSGLQKGIQGVTEETAQVLESLLNSVRYYTADSNMQLRNIYTFITGGSEIPNPILVELRNQTRLMNTMNRLLSGVVRSGHPQGGDGVKVFLN